MSQCCSKPDFTSEDKEKILLLQSKLDDIFLKRAQGAFVRPRAKWIEEGEKTRHTSASLLITLLLIQPTSLTKLQTTNQTSMICLKKCVILI